MTSFALTAGNAFGLLAMALCLASFAVKSMATLRWLALAANACFMLYGWMESVALSLLFNALLVPVNARRLWEIRRLSAEIERAGREAPVSQWLLPHMTRRTFRAGEVLFRKGDRAEEIFYVASGSVRIEEAGRVLDAGELFGEIGLFSPEHSRTQTAVCETDCELYRMTCEQMYRLYYQNPPLGFYFMRLVAERLLRDSRLPA